MKKGNKTDYINDHDDDDGDDDNISQLYIGAVVRSTLTHLQWSLVEIGMRVYLFG